MLILSRRPDQKANVYAADGTLVCSVMLVEIERGKVRLGFHADPSIGIYRAEIDPHHKSRVPLDDQEPEPPSETLPGIRT